MMDHSTAKRVFAGIHADEPDPREPNIPFIPGFVIDQTLGRGGGGTVYRGFREGSDRPLAIKILNTRLGAESIPFGSSGSSGRAWRELDLLTQLRLPALPRVIDHGVHEGRLYIAFEFVEGSTLDEYCSAHGLDLRDRVELLVQVAAAIQSLHEAGVLHRDIKPSNVLVDRAGRPVIIDLGIASLLSGTVMDNLTADGVPLGSPAFMSPEQARGSQQEVSTRSDVYGLGATSYVVLAGQSPHSMDGPLHATVRRVVDDDARDPRTLNPSIPKPLAAVLRKAVERNPARRYATATEFAHELRRWLDGDPVDAMDPSPWRICTRWISRHPLLSVSALCLLMVGATAIGSTGLALWLNWSPSHLEIDVSDGGLVRLRSVSGRELRTWRAAPGARVNYAELVRPDHSRPLVLTLMRRVASPEDGLDEQLCVWDAEHPSRMVWSTKRDSSWVTAPMAEQNYLDTFAVAPTVLVTDVFPENDGLECIAVHQHLTGHPSAIRVYDLSTGTVLYEVWHWGAIHDLYWLPEERVLVALAMSNELDWADLGVRSAPSPRPRTLFALKPTSTGTADDWVNGPYRTDTPACEWYRYLLPPALSANFVVKLEPHPDLALRQSAVEVQLRYPDSDATIFIAVDSEGHVTTPGVRVSDAYRWSSERYPPIPDIGLSDQPVSDR